MTSERLWKVWWLWGLPVAWATSALLVGAEFVRVEGLHRTGDVLDLVRLGMYWLWLRLAWRCADNVDHRAWSFLARAALVTGLVGHALV